MNQIPVVRCSDTDGSSHRDRQTAVLCGRDLAGATGSLRRLWFPRNLDSMNTPNQAAEGRHRQRQNGRLKLLSRWLPLFFAAVTGCGPGAEGPQLSFSEQNVWHLPPATQHSAAPRSVSCDDEDRVYVLDNAGRVILYGPTGELIRQWDMPASDIGRPEGICRLLDGRIAVADTHYHRVVLFHEDGSVESMFGEKGTDPGQFVFPVAVIQDPNGFLYVGEYGDRQRVQKLTADGEFVLQFGEHGIDEGQFQRPSGLVWRDGELFVVDAFNDRIQVFSENGEFKRVLQVPKEAAPLSFPYDIRATPDGHLAVIEHKGGRLTILSVDGSIVGRYGHPSRSLDGFFSPWGVAVLSDGRVLVADTGNHRLVELVP